VRLFIFEFVAAIASASALIGQDDGYEVYVASGLRDVAHGLPVPNASGPSTFLEERLDTVLHRHRRHRKAFARFTPGTFSQYGIADARGASAQVKTLPAAPDPTSAPPSSVRWFSAWLLLQHGS